jgi:predicted O-methyltransferase YrrM
MFHGWGKPTAACTGKYISKICRLTAISYDSNREVASDEIEILDNISKYWFAEGHLNFDQRDLFIKLLKDLKPKRCLEIGFASGRSTVTVLLAAQPVMLVSIDLCLDYIPGARAHANLLEKKFPTLKIIEGDSKAILNRTFFESYFPNGIDFAFVDGDHTYEGCSSDLSAVLPYINPGGIMLVDDYRSGPPNGVAFESVNSAVDDFTLRNRLLLTYWCKDGKGAAIMSKSESLSEFLKTVLFISLRRFYSRIYSAGSDLKRFIMGLFGHE